MAEQLDAEDLRNLAIINANRHQLDPESQRMLDGIVAQAGAPEYGPATLPTRGAAPRKRGDVYDQLAKRRGGSIPARTGPVKPVSPDEIKFDDPKTRNGGFWGGIVGSFNPIPMVDSMLDHATQLTVMGSREPSTADLVQATPFPHRLPFDIADTAQESSRRGAANESTSDMYGGVIGGVAQGLALDGIIRSAPAIRRASTSTARGLRKSALGTTEAHFERGAQPDLAAGETGVSLTREQQFEKTQAGKQSAMAAKDALLDHPSNASRTIDVDTPLTNAVRDFESNNIADLDPTTGTATVQTSLEARKFINGYKQKVNELTGGNPPTPRQADTLRRWVDDHITSFDQATPGSVRSLAQNVRNGLNENLVTNVEGLGAANKRIQSFIAAEDAARSTFYGGKSPTPVELLMRKGSAFIPTTWMKTGTATMLEKLGGSPSWDAVASVPTRRSIPTAATRGSTSTNTNTSPLGVADQAITSQLAEELTQQAGKSQARNADVPRRGGSPIDAVRSAAIRDAESKGVGIQVPTRTTLTEPSITPTPTTSLIEPDTEVQFGQQRQHGTVVKSDTHADVPSVLVETRDGYVRSVPISKLTILQRSKNP